VATADIIVKCAVMGNAFTSLSVEKESYSGTIRWQITGRCLQGVLLADFLQSGRIVNDGL